MLNLFLKSFAVILIVVVLMPTSSARAAYNQDYFGETVTYNAKFEDTLIHLARNNGLGFVELRAANPTLDPWIPGRNAKITLPKQHLLPEAPREGLVINLAEMRVYYFKEPGEEPLTFPISIGREGLQTPTGTTKIVRKKEGPTWRPTARMREEDPELPVSVPPGPDNPLGSHALYLGWPQYLMHGTNKPYGIGRRVSSGCMRMYPEDIEALFPQVPVGTAVNVVDQPVKAGWIGDDFYIEVSPTQDQAKAIEENGVLKTYEINKEDIALINRRAGDRKEDINWEKVRQVVKDHKGYPVAVIGKGNSRFQKIENVNNTYGVTPRGAKKQQEAEQQDAKTEEPTKEEVIKEANAQEAEDKDQSVDKKRSKSPERLNVYRANNEKPEVKTTTNIKLRSNRTYN
ncbi:MAG: L,D-transpeptidase family protein [Pseudomonadota bacterium]